MLKEIGSVEWIGLEDVFVKIELTKSSKPQNDRYREKKWGTCVTKIVKESCPNNMEEKDKKDRYTRYYRTLSCPQPAIISTSALDLINHDSSHSIIMYLSCIV